MYDYILLFIKSYSLVTHILISGFNFYIKSHFHCIKVALNFMTDLMIPVDWCMYVNVAYVYMCEYVWMCVL